MSAPRQSGSARFARWWMRLVLRFWPVESRDWGRALAAELDSIPSPVEAIRWVIGGTLLIGRALLSHFFAWLRLPVGARLHGSILHSSVQLPLRSPLFSGVLLITTAAILCLPQGRQALSAVKMSWGFSNFNSDIPALERIGRQADRQNDARTLAFVGLALSSSGICCPWRVHPDAMHYIEQAAAIDPSLAWIYGDRALRFGDRARQYQLLTRLKAADPENAVPYLLSADAILEQRYTSLIDHHAPTNLEVQASVENDAQLFGDVERAIRAPRFDNYAKNCFELIKAFYRRYPSLEPSTYLRGSCNVMFPGYFSLTTYASILIRRFKGARSPATFADATAGLICVVQFDERASYSSFDSRAIKALQGLQTTLVRRRHTEEAAAVGKYLQKLEQPRNHSNSICWKRGRFGALFGFGPLGRRAFLVHSLSFALVLLTSLLFASAAILEIPILGQWRLRRFVRRPACLFADLCPALLVPTCVAFLYAYQPFVRTIKTQVSQSTSLSDLEAIRGTYYSLSFLPSIMLPYVGWMFVPWVLACFLLALLALFILVRGPFRTRRPAKV